MNAKFTFYLFAKSKTEAATGGVLESTVTQVEKALIYDRLRVSKVS